MGVEIEIRAFSPGEAAAVRELLKLGLAAVATDGGPGLKSSSYGVFSRGADGHRDASGEDDVA